ncbi:MAG: helix-turn-helix domain-containing protein [Pseudomonadota bacterium]
MTKYAYSNDNELVANGLSEPREEVLGTVQPAGRTSRTEPSRMLGHDASTSAFKLAYFDPPKALERYILTLFYCEWGEGIVEDRHPGPMGHLYLTIKGNGTVNFDGHIDEIAPGPAMFNAFDVAAPFRLNGPYRCLGASLSPFGWAALTGVPVEDCKNRFLHARDLLGDDISVFTSMIIEKCLADEMTAEQACFAVADWIGARLKPIPATHEVFIEHVLAWLGSSLNPRLENLFDGQPYSRRQMERLVRRYFGFAPRGLARKFRAIRAAHLLAQDELSDEGAAEIAEAFVDQPHMIREIRRFSGNTPTGLGGGEDPMFIKLTKIRNLERLRPYREIGTDPCKS